MRDLRLSSYNTDATLTGNTSEGSAIQGTDHVSVSPGPRHIPTGLEAVVPTGNSVSVIGLSDGQVRQSISFPSLNVRRRKCRRLTPNRGEKPPPE